MNRLNGPRGVGRPEKLRSLTIRVTPQLLADYKALAESNFLSLAQQLRLDMRKSVAVGAELERRGQDVS
jgi:hypothetical protein